MRFPGKLVSFDGLFFAIADDVYEPSEDSILFAQQGQHIEARRVLDVGTGCGIIALILSRTAEAVVASDVSPHAIRCAKENAKLNGIKNVHFVQSDLLTAFAPQVRFDLITFNAPYLPVEEGEGVSWIEKAWSGGITGRETVDKFICAAPCHLSANGRILLLQSSLTGLEKTLHLFEENGLKACVVFENDLPFFEKLQLIEARHDSDGYDRLKV